MGQNRQQLRSKIEAELQRKIRAANIILNTYYEQQRAVDLSAAQAKQDVQMNFETMKKALVTRKNDLNHEIDTLVQNETFILQRRIQIMCLTLGSVQSTLNHLESIEDGQLANLETQGVPDVQSLPPPGLLKTNINCEQLKAGINAWGSVDVGDAFQGRTGNAEAGTSASAGNDVDMRSGGDFIFMSPESPDSESDDDLDDLPELVSIYDKIPLTNQASNNLPPSIPATTSSEQKLAEVPELVSNFGEEVNSYSYHWPSSVSVEAEEEYFREKFTEWLSPKENDKRSEDDFEVLSMEQEAEQSCGTSKVMPTSDAHIVPDISEVCSYPNEADEKTSEVTDNESDMPELEEPVTETELSKWLKPGMWSSTPSASTSSLGENLKGIPETRSISKVATKKRFFEYPGLRLDPNCWLHRAPAKGLEEFLRCSDEVSMTLNQKEIIPPTYALPYPYWLKK